MLNTSNVLFDEKNRFTDLSTSYDRCLVNENGYKIEINSEICDYKIASSEENEAAHEAGFDSLMTSVVFLRSLE